MTFRAEHQISVTPFSGGFRLQRRLTPPRRAELRLDWSWSQLAIDRAGRLVELVDVPAAPHAGTDPARRRANWFRTAAGAGSRHDRGRGSPLARCGDRNRKGKPISPRAADPRSAGSTVLRSAGYAGMSYWHVRIEPPLESFEKYLLRLNANLRFVRLGFRDDCIALQAVLPSDDPGWLNVAQDALIHVRDLLQKQVAWWGQPRVLVKELFHQARL